MSMWMTSGARRLRARQNRTFAARAQQRATFLQRHEHGVSSRRSVPDAWDAPSHYNYDSQRISLRTRDSTHGTSAKVPTNVIPSIQQLPSVATKIRGRRRRRLVCASVSVVDTRRGTHRQRYGDRSESQPLADAECSQQRRFLQSAGHRQMPAYTPSPYGSEVPYAYPRTMPPPRHCDESQGTPNAGSVRAVMSPFGLRVTKRARLDRGGSRPPQHADNPSDFASRMPRQLFRSSSHEGGSYSDSHNMRSDWEEWSHSTQLSARERSFVHSHRTSPFQAPSPLPTDDDLQHTSALSHFHNVNYLDVRHEDAATRGEPKATPGVPGTFAGLERSPDSVSSQHMHHPDSTGHFSPPGHTPQQMWHSSPAGSCFEVPVHPNFQHPHHMATSDHSMSTPGGSPAAHFPVPTPPPHPAHYQSSSIHRVPRARHYTEPTMQHRSPVVGAFSTDSARVTGSTFRSSSFDRSEYLACSLGKEEIATVIRRRDAPTGGIEKFSQRNRWRNQHSTPDETQPYRKVAGRPMGRRESSRPSTDEEHTTPPKLRFFNEEVEVDIKGVALTDKVDPTENSHPSEYSNEDREGSSSFKLATPKRKPASGSVVGSVSRKRSECPSSAPPGASGDESSGSSARRLQFRRVVPNTVKTPKMKGRQSPKESCMEVIKGDMESTHGRYPESPSLEKPRARTKKSTTHRGRQDVELLEEVFSSEDMSRGKSTDEDDGTVATEPASIISESNDSNEAGVAMEKSTSRDGEKTLSAAKTLLCFMDAMSCGN